MVKIITVNNWILKETLRFISMIKFQLATQVKFKLKPTDLTPNLDKLILYKSEKFENRPVFLNNSRIRYNILNPYQNIAEDKIAASVF